MYTKAALICLLTCFFRDSLAATFRAKGKYICGRSAPVKLEGIVRVEVEGGDPICRAQVEVSSNKQDVKISPMTLTALDTTDATVVLTYRCPAAAEGELIIIIAKEMFCAKSSDCKDYELGTWNLYNDLEKNCLPEEDKSLEAYLNSSNLTPLLDVPQRHPLPSDHDHPEDSSESTDVDDKVPAAPGI